MDPLSLLREHNIAGKPVLLQGDQMLFGSQKLPRDTPTAYRSLGNGAFYTIDQLWFFLQSSKMSHANYLMACNKNKIKAVSLPDKRDLIAYLSGQSDNSNNIDLANAPLVADVEAPTGELPSSQTARPAEAQKDIEDEQQLRELAAEARRMVREALEGPALIEVPADPVLDSGAAAEGAPGVEPPVRRLKRKAAPMPTGDALRALVKADMPETERIRERELPGATRSSILLAANSKQFKRVEQVVRSLQEQARTTPVGPPKGPPPPGGRPQPPAQAVARPRSGPPVAPPTLIIIVPAAITCTINMWNVADFLVRGMYVSPADKRKDPTARKELVIKHAHKLTTGQALKFEIIDNFAKLNERDWQRVVAVVLQGNAWQFKGWPFKDTVSTFASVRGFYVRFSDEVTPDMVRSSDVKTLTLSKETAKRYLDSTVAKEFWMHLEKFLLQHKRHLVGGASQ